MSDNHWHRFLWHAGAVAAAMLVWTLPLDFMEALAGSIVAFFLVSGVGERRHGPLAGPRDIRADIEERFGRRLGE
ncbi:MAG: hypothetical protein RLZ98_3202 [Pseudomonadota bacterium]|jgi:hypothetical protein